jgi:hypothetical protein
MCSVIGSVDVHANIWVEETHVDIFRRAVEKRGIYLQPKAYAKLALSPILRIFLALSLKLFFYII